MFLPVTLRQKFYFIPPFRTQSFNKALQSTHPLKWVDLDKLGGLALFAM